MAMTKCKECGKDISTLAKTCPHCGAPTSPVLDTIENGAKAAESIGSVLFLVGAVIIALLLLATCAF